MSDATPSANRGPWWWVPSLYFAQALPYVLVMTVSTYAYKRLGISVVLIGYTAWLGLPWMFKPLWSPLVEIIGTERRWIWITQYIAALGFSVVAIGYTTEHFFLWTAVGYSLLAFAAATHDIAADGFYMRVLEPHDQTWFSGIRSVAFRGGWIFGEGLLVMLAGRLMKWDFTAADAWSVTHYVAAATFFVLATYHAWVLPIAPPKPATTINSVPKVFQEVIRIFRLFFEQIPIATAIPFLLLYRFAEAQVVKLLGAFLIDDRTKGGMGLNEEQIGTINGTLGVAALLAGGVIAGMLASRDGLRKWLLPMCAAMNLTNVTFLLLAFYQPTNLLYVSLAVVIEKFGYGLGFTGFMMYMLYLAQGKHQTSFYAICTGFMTLGLIVPGSFAGKPVEWFGYTGFFMWILVCTIPSFIATWIVYRQMDPQFGRRAEAAS